MQPNKRDFRTSLLPILTKAPGVVPPKYKNDVFNKKKGRAH